jgi:ESCRT-I complex subunit TSG101
MVLIIRLLTLVAEDATIEDTLYFLEKSLGIEGVNLEAFLKAYRTLANEQFLKRATIKKVHEKQRGQ